MPVTVTLTGIAHGGEALGLHEGKIVFVPYAIPGETVEVEIVEEKPRWARARLVKVLTQSPDRVVPPCPYFGQDLCGGCQLQHIDYEKQLALKVEVVADQLRRLGGIAQPPVLEPIALADDTGLLDFGYRNHAQLVAGQDGQLGFIRDGAGRGGEVDRGRGPERSKDVIPVEACLLLHPLLDELHAALIHGAAGDGALDDSPQDGEPEDSGDAPAQAIIRRVGLRAGVNTRQRLLVFETMYDRVPAFMVEDVPVRCALRERNGATQSLIGEPWIEEVVAGRTFRVSAGSFFQVNTVGAEALVDLAAAMLEPQSHQTLLDGYCGVGLFALSLAGQVGQVIGIEESESACDDFAWNAQDLDNVNLYEGPVADVLAAFDSENVQRIDLALIDPPRSGAGPEVVRHLHRLGVPKLLYVACDPATLARDAKLLIEAGYTLQQVQPVDMFPQTYHVESLALFTL